MASTMASTAAGLARADAASDVDNERGPWLALADGGRIELRRQSVDRGSEDESSKTTVRLEKNLQGITSRLRLDLPFPDEKDGFTGDPFNPRLGDIKLKAFFRPFSLGGSRLGADVELTFPTAHPGSMGAGKYQFGPALFSVPGQPDWQSVEGGHRFHVDWTVRQTLSFAGDPARKNINTTKPELALRDVIGSDFSLKLTFKPVIDWVNEGKTSGVLELEGVWNIEADWRLTCLAGAGLWGRGVSGYYGRKLELVAGRRF